MTVKLISAPRKTRGTRTTAQHDSGSTPCGAQFSYVPSDVRSGWGDDGRGRWVQYRVVTCPHCRTAAPVEQDRLAPEDVGCPDPTGERC